MIHQNQAVRRRCIQQTMPAKGKSPACEVAGSLVRKGRGRAMQGAKKQGRRRSIPSTTLPAPDIEIGSRHPVDLRMPANRTGICEPVHTWWTKLAKPDWWCGGPVWGRHGPAATGPCRITFGAGRRSAVLLIAFSSEVDTGSRSNQACADCVDLSAVENASKQESRASVLIQSEPITL